VTFRPATFTKATAWVQLAPDQFARHLPHVTTIWQAEDSRVWVEDRRRQVKEVSS